MGIYEQLSCVTNHIVRDEPMKNHTSFQIGGPADIMAVPETVEELKAVSLLLLEGEVPHFFMGNGSNLLVSDQGYRGVVVKTTSLRSLAVEDDELTVDAGVILSKAANTLLKHGLSGLEALSGIPGTVGGAVYMNAGAYGAEIKDVLLESLYLDGTQLKILPADAHDFSYRHSFFTGKPYCILSSKLKCKPDDPAIIKERMADFTNRRVTKQPLTIPSAGSTFKRPEGFFASKLIEDCGLKGKRVGGACVSEKHSGFLVNEGGATCADMLKLIELVKREVYRRFGVLLELEVKTIEENWKGILE